MAQTGPTPPPRSGTPRPNSHSRLFRRVDQSAVMALMATGLTQGEIGAQLGVSEQTIWRRCKAWGLETPRTGPRSGPGHPSWIDGRRIGKHGYVTIYAPRHPQAGPTNGGVPEHRLVMELQLGRFLERREVVHHRDEHPRHNWPLNLRLFASNAAHLQYELAGRWKTSPKSSIPGAYKSHQKISRCPGADETLARCPSGFHAKLDAYIATLRPTSAHQAIPRRQLRGRCAPPTACPPPSTD